MADYTVITTNSVIVRSVTKLSFFSVNSNNDYGTIAIKKVLMYLKMLIKIPVCYRNS